MVKRGFHELRVSEIERQTDDAVAVRFEVPGHLRDAFAFRPGQFLTLRRDLDGEDVRRTYSICCAPEEGLRVGIKEIRGGRFSTFANRSLQTGDVLEVMPPDGRFGVAPGAGSHHYLAVAAGSGITPVLSIIASTLAQEPETHFTVLYGNRSTPTVMFREDLEDLKNRYRERLQLFYVFSRERQDVPLLSGRLDREKCDRFFESVLDASDYDAAFLCGPHGMIEDVRASLMAHGMDEVRIQNELFTTNGSAPVSVPDVEPEGADGTLIVHLDGQETELPVSSAVAVLDSALGAGLDLPFACKGGVCCTCKAKLIEGEVDMEVHYGLEPDELEEGYIVTCQAKPKSPRVVVDFDA